MTLMVLEFSQYISAYHSTWMTICEEASFHMFWKQHC